MEIADIRKAQKDKAEKQKQALLGDPPKPVHLGANPSAVGAFTIMPTPVAIILCASCKHWERSDAKAPFAACGLSRRYGLPVAAITTDKTTCSLAEAR